MSYYSKARDFHERGKYEEAYNLYVQGVQAGEEKCFYGVGVCFYSGYFVKEDKEKALRIFAEHFHSIYYLANSGDAEAVFIIAYHYLFGFCVEKNFDIFLRLLTKSAELGYSIAQWRLGVFYETGQGVEQDTYRAANLYRLSAEQGDFYGQWLYGVACYKGKGTRINKMEGFRWIKAAAENGMAEAQFFICGCYLDGRLVGKNDDEAIKWCELAARQGYEEAIKSLDDIKYGMVCEKIAENVVCSAEDIQLLFKMEQKGKIGANGLLESALLNRSRYLSRVDDYTALSECIALYEMLIGNNAAYSMIVANELSNACYKVANIYEHTVLDIPKALEYYIKADSYGCDKAKFNIAMLYYEGDGIIKDYSKAIYNFKKCTVLGIEEGKSHYFLGNCFYWGLGVPADMELAKKHYISAYEYGFNCDYIVEATLYELGENSASTSMKAYGELMKQQNLSDEKRSLKIIEDLKKDFGESWNLLKKDSRQALVTSMDTYIYMYLKGAHIYGNYDFSMVISEMCKALEIELVYYLYTNYINFLKIKGINPNSFVGKRTFLKKRSANDFAYENPLDTDNCTLGSIDITIGSGRKFGSVVDESMVDYLDEIFKYDAFSSVNRRQEICEYIGTLSNAVFTIKEDYRNHAVHSKKMKCEKAQACGDQIIKVRRLLIDFLEKIKA